MQQNATVNLNQSIQSILSIQFIQSIESGQSINSALVYRFVKIREK